MYVPKINTTKGRQPVTILPDAYLLEGFLYSDAPAEDKEVVKMLMEGADEVTGAFALRSALEGGELVLVYPRLNQKAPKGAELLCSVADGALYLVKAP